MSTAAKLKKKAADYEQKKQFDKALQLYLEALEVSAGAGDEADVALYNRVGDLYMRANNVAEGMKYYDSAVDLYAEGGFYNNAIALCNKILRLAPGRNAVYYKLGRISARKGFINDAKQNFLEYAHRMQTAGQLDEAFRALKEFADLVPDQEDVRLMLAEQLTKQGRTAEAVEQLQRLFEKFEAEGRGAEMAATVDRMKQIGAREPGGAARARRTPELVFLDLSDEKAGVPLRPPAPAPARPTEDAPVVGASPDLPFIHTGQEDASPAAPRPTSGSGSAEAAAEPAPTPEASGTIPTPTPGGSMPAVEPLDSRAFAKLRLPTPLDLPAIESVPHDLVIPGDLPAVDRALAPPGAAPGRPDAHARAASGGRGLSLTPEMTVLIPDDALPPGRPAAPARPAQTPARPGGRPPIEPPPVAASPPVDWVVRRKAAEALFEKGDREGGVRELDRVMLGLERDRDITGARSVVEEILRINPNSVRHHQKRVEYAVRGDETSHLPDLYIELGDALVRDGQLEPARAIYRRVLEIAPNDPRASTALSTFGEQASRPAARGPSAPAARPTPAEIANGAPPAAGAGSDFVNLGDWLRDDAGPRSTRMVVPEHRPTGDEAADFDVMLRTFKAAVAQNVDLDDSESHFDLGVAYKEMGLLDEAIAEFQKALLGPGRRVRTYEALGQCFLEKHQPAVASTILSRALQEAATTEEQLVGVLYLLGYAAEAMGRSEEAIRYYQRVFAVDIEFRDVTRRLAGLEQGAR
jgi:tetratricopeptide (TPR) repeat protein